MSDVDITAKALRSLALLNELIMLKSAQDGVPRPALGSVGSPLGNDAFQKDVQNAAELVMFAAQMAPDFVRLSAVARAMEERGKLQARTGDSLVSTLVKHLEAASAPEDAPQNASDKRPRP